MSNELDKLERAKVYLEKLANGTDPISGNEMPLDSVLNNVRLSRCFFYVSDVLRQVIENGGSVRRSPKGYDFPFSITAQQAAQIQFSEEPVGVTVLNSRITAVLDEGVKPLAAVKINNWLLSQGYLREEIAGNKKRRVATTLGERVGIVTLDGVSQSGIPYKSSKFTIEAQRFIVENLNVISNFEQ